MKSSLLLLLLSSTFFLLTAAASIGNPRFQIRRDDLQDRKNNLSTDLDIGRDQAGWIGKRLFGHDKDKDSDSEEEDDCIECKNTMAKKGYNALEILENCKKIGMCTDE